MTPQGIMYTCIDGPPVRIVEVERMRNRAGFLLVTGMLTSCGVMLPLVGCVESTPTRPTKSTMRTDGPFVPVRTRIHPLTRIVSGEDGERVVEVHLELYDYWNHAVKGVGTVLFELYRDRTMGGGVTGSTQEMRWPVIDIRDPEVNSRPYDPVTRTYLFKLRGLPEELPPGRIILHATFTTAGGQRLPTAEHVIE